MWSRTALVFLLVFAIAFRMASALSWASIGAPLTTLGLVGASSLAGIAAFGWYASHAVKHEPAFTSKNDRWVAAH